MARRQAKRRPLEKLKAVKQLQQPQSRTTKLKANLTLHTLRHSVYMLWQTRSWNGIQTWTVQVIPLFSFKLTHGKQCAAVHFTTLILYALADKILEWHPDMDGAGNTPLQFQADAWQAVCCGSLHNAHPVCTGRQDPGVASRHGRCR